MSKKEKAPSQDDLTKLIAEKDAEYRKSKGEPEKTGEPMGKQLSKDLFTIDKSSKLYVKGFIK